jgi:hypothetical protein
MQTEHHIKLDDDLQTASEAMVNFRAHLNASILRQGSSGAKAGRDRLMLLSQAASIVLQDIQDHFSDFKYMDLVASPEPEDETVKNPG